MLAKQKVNDFGEAIKTASDVDILKFAQANGYNFKKVGSDCYNCIKHESLAITPSINRFFIFLATLVVIPSPLPRKSWALAILKTQLILSIKVIMNALNTSMRKTAKVKTSLIFIIRKKKAKIFRKLTII